jgi:hypothetical protein
MTFDQPGSATAAPSRSAPGARERRPLFRFSVRERHELEALDVNGGGGGGADRRRTAANGADAMAADIEFFLARERVLDDIAADSAELARRRPTRRRLRASSD